MGIQYAGFTVFPISPRNSPEAIAHLLAEARVDHVLVGREQVYRDLFNRSLGVLKSKYLEAQEPAVSVAPLFEDLYTPFEGDANTVKYKVPPKDAPVLMVHSSGAQS